MFVTDDFLLEVGAQFIHGVTDNVISEITKEDNIDIRFPEE